MVALTFDDGPDPEWTPPVLDALARAGAQATFFVVAEQMRAPGGAELVAETLRRGHAVQMHCARHLRHESLALAGIRADAARSEAALAAAGVPAPALWRPPYGSVSPARSCLVAAERGLQLVRWTLDPRDYRGTPPDEMLELVGGGPLREDSVVLLHDSRRYSSTPGGGAANTVALIGPLVGRIRAAGWEPVALRSPLRRPAPPQDGFLLPCAAAPPASPAPAL